MTAHRNLGVLALALSVLLAGSAQAHIYRPASTAFTRIPMEFDGPREVSLEAQVDLSARFMVDGLLRETDWNAVQCSQEVIDVSREGYGDSESFCFRRVSEQPDTLVEVEEIFRRNQATWEEIGWAKVQEALGGVYRSRAMLDRYMIIIIGEHHAERGYTDVIVSVTDRPAG